MGSSNPAAPPTGAALSSKASIERFVQRVVNDGESDGIDELIAADFLGHRPSEPTLIAGPDGVLAAIAACRDAIDDLHVTVTDQISEEDQVAVSWIATGSRSGAPLRLTGISIVRMLAGKQVESRTECHCTPTGDRPRGNDLGGQR